MQAKNIAEAWRMADDLFPTDYTLDYNKTERAGANIYVSTADGNDSWISDLGTRLEVNIVEGATCKSYNIQIDEEPAITTTRRIDWLKVRDTCIREDWYTCGDVKAYEKMLDEARANDGEYTVRKMYRLACDILEHSEGTNTIENVMYILDKAAVDTFYDIEH